jgi:hypothetical protein
MTTEIDGTVLGDGQRIIATKHWKGSSTDVWFSLALPSGKRLDLGSVSYADEFFRTGLDEAIEARKREIAGRLAELGVKIEL